MGFIVPPSQWEIEHARPIFAAQKYQDANNGQLPDTRVWRMLEFRHDLNPARFNFFHPNIGRMIERQDTPTPLPPPAEQGLNPPPVDPPLTPPVEQEIVDPPPGGVGGVATPEPSSLLMLASAVLTLGLGYNRSRRRSS